MPDVHGRKPEGVVPTSKGLRKEGHDVTHYHEYGIAKSKDLAADSVTKTKQRKWAGYERIYSNAIRHTGRHAMKGSGI